jgi:hypothetical protein
MLLRVRASQPMVQLPPDTDAIGIALDAEHREALDEVMSFGIRNKNVLSWLERWRYDWRTHPFLVAGCSLSRQRRGDHSENESAAGGLARDWAEALTLGQATATLFNTLSDQRADKSRRLKAFIYLALTEPHEREFERLLHEGASKRDSGEVWTLSR